MARLQNKPNISISGLNKVDSEIHIWPDSFIRVYENKSEIGKIDCLENGVKRRTIGEAFGVKIQTDAVLIRGHGRSVINRMLSSRHRTSIRKIHINGKLLGSLSLVYGARSAWLAKNLPIHNRVKKWETLFYDNSTKEVQIYSSQNLEAVFRLIGNGKYSFYVRSQKNKGIVFALFVATLDSAEVIPEELTISKEANIKNDTKKKDPQKESKPIEIKKAKKPEKVKHDKTFRIINKNADMLKTQLKKAERIQPYLNDLNVSYKRAASSLTSLGKIKLNLLDKFEKFTANLKEIENLPEFVELNNPYAINNPSTREFISRINAFKNNDLSHKLVGLYGFNFQTIKEDDLIICSLENELFEIDINSIDDCKTIISNIRTLINLYNQIYRYSVSYSNKLKTCLVRYGVVLTKLNNLLKRSNDYKKIRKLVDSFYYSTLLIMDLINTNLVVDNKINVQELNNKMKRRMI